MKQFGLSLLFFFLVSPVFAADLVINEFVAAPSVGNPEWVEFYNASSSAEYLKSYYLDDDTSFDSDIGSSNKKILTTINTSDVHHPFFVLSSSMLNNDGDSVVLFDPSGSIVDQFTYYENPGADISIGRYPDQTGSFKTLSLSTQGQANAPPPVTPTPTSTNTPTPTNTPAQTNTPTNTPSTNISTPTLLPTKTPTRRPTPTVTPSDTPTPEASHSGEVLSLTDPVSSTPIATPSGTLKPLTISFALIGAGLGILSLLLLWQKRDLFTRPKGPDDITSS